MEIEEKGNKKKSKYKSIEEKKQHKIRIRILIRFSCTSQKNWTAKKDQIEFFISKFISVYQKEHWILEQCSSSFLTIRHGK